MGFSQIWTHYLCRLDRYVTMGYTMRMRWLVMLLGVMLLGACGGSGDGNGAITEPVYGGTPTTYVPLEYDQVFDKAQDNQFVRLEGYLSLPSMMYTTGKTAQVNFHARAYQRHGREITSNIRMGACRNCMATLPEKYKTSDFQLTADDSTQILAYERVRLYGSLHVSDNALADNGLMVSLDVEKVERVAEVAIDYATLDAVKLDKSNLEDSTLKYVLTYAQGKLTIPSILFMENDISLFMSIGGTDVSINFLFGTGPNQIEEIPENYSKADFKIHDFEGKLINLSKPVKVWGNRATPRKGAPGILYVEHLEQ
jgi:hypothetical protein